MGARATALKPVRKAPAQAAATNSSKPAPVPAPGLFALMSEEQREAALSYAGPEELGDPAFASKPGPKG